MKRAIKNEAGFTLTEVLVTIMMMTMVVFALYSMFDMSLRVFQTGNSTVEANENARVALDRMEREIRSAWPSNDCEDPSQSDDPLIGDSSNSGSITFKNCFSDTDPPRTINYRINGDNLERVEDGSAQTLASLGSSPTPLRFRYLNAASEDVPTANAILVEITLVAQNGDRTQTLITNAGLRNAN